MSILARFTPSSLTAEKYDEINRAASASSALVYPPEGLDYHVCFGSDDDLRVTEIWDSREQCDVYTQKLMPMLAEFGIVQFPEPEIMEIHNIVKR